MVDHDSTAYTLKTVKPNKALLNKIVRLRCVEIRNKKIILTKRSSCLILPTYFYDNLKFQNHGKSN